MKDATTRDVRMNLKKDVLKKITIQGTIKLSVLILNFC